MSILNRSALLTLLLSISFVGPLFAKGTVVAYIEPKSTFNPAPAAPLSSFQRFEILPITMQAPFAGQKANEEAKGNIQANLDLGLQPVLAEWNAKVINGPTKTLRIEPVIRHIKFIGTGARIWAGGMAGGSAVLMTVRLSDAETGELIAEPEFYQHASRHAGAWSFGATDRAMLVRVATMITDYLQKNYSAAVGGPSSVAPAAKP